MPGVISTSWRADKRTLMTIYQSQLRSKIEYGCIVYNLAHCRELSSLSSVANEDMIIASGCFKSTSKTSIQVMTKERALQITRNKLSLKVNWSTETLETAQIFQHCFKDLIDINYIGGNQLHCKILLYFYNWNSWYTLSA